MGVSHGLQCKPLRCLRLARKVDTKATGPVSILSVPGYSLFLVCAHCLPLADDATSGYYLSFKACMGRVKQSYCSWHHLQGLVPATLPMTTELCQSADGMGSWKAEF